MNVRACAVARGAVSKVAMATVAVSALAYLATALPVAAQGASPAAPATLDALPSTWRFELLPYLWGAGMSGRVRPFAGAPTVSFARSARDILEEVDAAILVAGEATRGHLVLLADGSRVATSRAGTVPGGVPAEARMRQTMLFAAAGWRADVSPRHHVDVFAGLRSLQLEADVILGPGVLSTSPRRHLVDPVVGARAAVALTPRWTGRLHADLGGFGVGTESTVTLQALTDVALTRRIALTAGYRAMLIDHDDKGTLVDVALGGLLGGVRLRF